MLSKGQQNLQKVRPLEGHVFDDDVMNKNFREDHTEGGEMDDAMLRKIKLDRQLKEADEILKKTEPENVDGHDYAHRPQPAAGDEYVEQGHQLPQGNENVPHADV